MAESVVRVHRISIDEADRRDTSKAKTAKLPQSADAMEPDHLKWTFHETTVVRHRLQNAFGGRNMVGCAGIDFHRRAQRPAKSLEDGFNLVVRIPAADVVDM
jgi:hypothetical protein